MSKAYPGKVIGKIYNYSLGEGVYRKDDNIIASLKGEVIVDTNVNPPKISVSRSKETSYKPKIGDEVYCKVTKVTKNFSNCDIIATKEYLIGIPISATIRSESVKNDFKDFDMFDCFKPGDVILAKIISTDLTNLILLSTVDVDHGVVFGRSLLSENLMMPISFDKMLCMDSGIYERRKVAKPQLN